MCIHNHQPARISNKEGPLSRCSVLKNAPEAVEIADALCCTVTHTPHQARSSNLVGRRLRSMGLAAKKAQLLRRFDTVQARMVSSLAFLVQTGRYFNCAKSQQTANSKSIVVALAEKQTAGKQADKNISEKHYNRRSQDPAIHREVLVTLVESLPDSGAAAASVRMSA
ncbi:unnamed protein product [Peronospora belbahrii]|uniref:Uncharacterized protein n=1 Tax=Peronospora belbahrii TaxID=622444 RepID=A0ABN8D4I3_9STRA|nr:unnamed protein product [Peronospora belbahrii]